MSKKKPKFKKVWASATNIAREFGISAIALNKLLAEKGLRDPVAKEPTAQALASGLAISTPLKDGTPHFMWNSQEVRKILGPTHQKLSHREVVFEEFVRGLLKCEKEAEETGFDKLPYLYFHASEPDLKGVTAEVVVSTCNRLGIKARIAEFQEMVTGN